jgi:nicotinate-nucleotide pyrophosphorylase (carboxylating)
LIKENHALAAGGVVEAVRRARQGAAAAGASGLRVMCEAETVEEVRHLVESGAQGRPDRILLDNMPPERMAQCVTVIRAAAPQIQIEATGSIGLEAARTVAETGVDLISVGALTHSAPALDLSLLVEAD